LPAVLGHEVSHQSAIGPEHVLGELPRARAPLEQTTTEESLGMALGL
jgi:hypothetical protein